MDFMLNIKIDRPERQINYSDNIMLVGSCFTEHIGNKLEELKFSVLQNPNGILFDPRSVAYSLVSYSQNKEYEKNDLFFLNETWQSWQHHSRYANVDADKCLHGINESQKRAHQFLKNADWLIITLGSAFSYHLTEQGAPHAGGVANCHRAPAQWFNKHMMTIEEINSALDACIHQLWQFNPKLKIIFTVSPVRHIRDGVIENNRSKARLIEVVHHLVNKFDRLYYFPAYELVIDVLRDYRFYDIDMVHPNYAATEFVLEKFSEYFIDEESRNAMEEVRKVVIARKHRALQPGTNAHRSFLKNHLEKAKQLSRKYAFLDLSEEMRYFASAETLQASQEGSTGSKPG